MKELDTLETRAARVAEQITQALYGCDPEDRVRALRAQILGISQTTKMIGLSAWLDREENNYEGT